jgi:dipeptidase E
MKFYLSSYKFGDDIEKLKTLLPKNIKALYISNAMDVDSVVQSRDSREQEDVEVLTSIGLLVDHIDLKQYFGKKSELKQIIESSGVIWVCGGNTFVLRQAMQLSGFDEVLIELMHTDKLYGGYSAGCAVLSNSLKGLHLMDAPNVFPYLDYSQTIWEGLGVMEYLFVPHYQSDHPESPDADNVIEYCQSHQLSFQAVSDGEVMIFQKNFNEIAVLDQLEEAASKIIVSNISSLEEQLKDL